jgi:hypothetical protein
MVTDIAQGRAEKVAPKDLAEALPTQIHMVLDHIC